MAAKTKKRFEFMQEHISAMSKGKGKDNMGKTILIALLHKRRASAPEFQQIITDYGCIIKTRLGIHDGVLDKCSDEGLIILELVGERVQIEEMKAKLDALAGVATRLVDISF